MIRTLVTLAALAAFPVQLTSQVQTRTDYGALAIAGTGSDFESVDAQTTVGSGGLVVAANVGGTRDLAFSATTSVTLAGRTGATGVQVVEGGVARATAAARGSAGTSPSNRGSSAPVFGAHAVSLHVAARQGARARVSIAWSGAATGGAGVRTAIDVDGDQQPDFAARAGGRLTQDLFVTAGARGVTVDIETEGLATLAGVAGSESYSATLSVHVTLDGGGGGNCTITPFGAECGGRLAGTATSTTRDLTIDFGVSGAAANAIGILVIGDRLLPPIPLPGSRCELLVLPRLTGLMSIDGSGAGRASVRIPGGQPLDTNAQVVTLAVGAGIDLASTNGLNIVCR